jgi:preprotein translocase subunit SecF
MHYLEPMIYLEGLSRQFQVILGVLAALVNIAVYVWIYLRKKKKA